MRVRGATIEPVFRSRDAVAACTGCPGGFPRAQRALHPRGARCRSFVLLVCRVGGVEGVSGRAGLLVRERFAPSSRCCMAFRRRWRVSGHGGGCREEVHVGSDCAEVIPVAGGPAAFRTHPQWMGVVVEGERVLLVSSGRRAKRGFPRARRTWERAVRWQACSRPAMAATDDVKGLGNEAKQQVGSVVQAGSGVGGDGAGRTRGMGPGG